jgi:hypothetical protein
MTVPPIASAIIKIIEDKTILLNLSLNFFIFGHLKSKKFFLIITNFSKVVNR